ncbi:glycosyltransferase family 4 protein [bacterium]|nr:glycosyltransferase family 4 protein [bacterium]
MRVCVDAQASTERGGIGRYVRCLVDALARLDDGDEFVPFRFDFRFRDSPFADGVHERVCRWAPGRAVQYAWRTWQTPAFDRFAPRADLYHFPNYLRPPLRRGRSVVTVHDAAYARVPETLEERNLRNLVAHLGESLRRADAIIADSEFTAGEYRGLFPELADRVHAVPLGLPDDLARPDDDAIRGTRARLGLERPYLLTVGTIEPRKNHDLLVSAFERSRHRDLDLVVAGPDGWKCAPILERLRASSRASAVRRIPYVAERDLPALYAGAELFAFPSLYEGFGFPPLEAMRCGTPVVAAARGSLPEVLGDAAHFPDETADGWASAMDDLLDDAEARAELVRRGGKRSRAFTWGETARRTRAVYGTVLET